MCVCVCVCVCAGLVKDDKTLRELKVTAGAKMMLVGSTINDVITVQPPSADEVKKLRAESAGTPPAGYFLVGGKGGIFPHLTAVFPPFRLAVIIFSYTPTGSYANILPLQNFPRKYLPVIDLSKTLQKAY